MSPILPVLLLVDDDPYFRDSLAMVLARRFTVHTAECAEDALDQILRGLYPDAILSDVSMPGIGSAGLLEQLPPLLRARTAFITAGIANLSDYSAIQDHRRPLLRKPARIPQLLGTLQELLDQPPDAAKPPDVSVSLTA